MKKFILPIITLFTVIFYFSQDKRKADQSPLLPESKTSSTSSFKNNNLLPYDSRAKDIESFDPNLHDSWELEARPLPVTFASDRFEWTSEDLLSEDSLKILANNPKMLERMKLETNYTTRRQLVYIKPQFNTEAHELFDKASKNLIIPGFDGEEVQIQVDETMLHDMRNWEGEDPTKVTGSFVANISDDENIQVSVGVSNDNWSISVIYPEGHTTLIEERRSGEWIISSIDSDIQKRFDLEPCHQNRTLDDVGLLTTNK